MKKFKKFVSLLAVAAILAVAPGATALKAEAAAPTTFYIGFVEEENSWRVQVNEWDKDSNGRELYYLNNGDERVKDGDAIVIMENDPEKTDYDPISVDAYLSNLTVNHATVAIETKGIETCAVLERSSAAVTGNIQNASVYDGATASFHSNVTNLYMISTIEDNITSDITVGGTVAYACEDGAVMYFRQYYNFAKGTFHYSGDRGLVTDPSNYSLDGNGPAATTPAPAPSTPSTGSQGSTSSSGAYDDVPKTGESNMAVWLFAISAACFAGCAVLRKSEQN